MSQTVIGGALLCIWIVFLAFWAISAIGVKRDIKRTIPSGGSVLLRMVLITGLAIYVDQMPGSPLTRLQRYSVHVPLAFQMIGLVLAAAGVAFAIWARIHLGRNWSPVPALKENHELVTSGPYRFVRNPIYTGLLVALLGSALVAGFTYWVAFVLCIGMFVYRVFAEDRLMMQQFPNTYPAYRRKTKALIPFVV